MSLEPTLHGFVILTILDRILVLKDGRVVEQGTFKELVALDGLFASMWADQASATEDPAVSLAAGSVGKGASTGHDENDEAVIEEQHPTGNHASREEARLVATPEQLSTLDLPPTETISQKDDAAQPVSEAIAFPSSAPDADETKDNEMKVVPASFPQDNSSSQPLAFPSSDPEPQGSGMKPAPAVTFGDGVNPSRTATPDPESEPKRKRISSQNFQRLARRISLTTRRQGSSSMIPSIPGLKRDSSPRVSVDDSARDADSATGSVKGDDKGKKKKDKKDKSRKSTL